MKREEEMKQIGELISEFITQGKGIYLMAWFFLTGFVIDVMLFKNILYITSECADIRHSSAKIIKHLWMKYEGFEKTRQHVNNTGIFVDKYIFGWKICGIPVRLLTRIEKVMALSCIYAGIAFGMYSYMGTVSTIRAVIYVGGGMLMYMGLIMWRDVLGLNEKFEHMKVCVTYALESMYAKTNVVSVIGENIQGGESQKNINENKQENRQDVKTNTNKKVNITAFRNDRNEKNAASQISVSEEEEIIKEVLDEFLV